MRRSDEGTGRAQPIFVGGKGHTGAAAIGKLLGQHSRFAFLPVELCLHATNRGLTDLLTGGSSIERFRQTATERCYRRMTGKGGETGLFTVIDEDTFSVALDRFEAEYETDAREAARTLVHSICDPKCHEQGKRAWVDATPENETAAATLLELFPNSKVIHMLRDGRDVVRSRVHRGIERDWMTGLDRWGEQIRWIEEEHSHLPRGRTLTMRLEELTWSDREGTYARLLAFLEVDDEPAMRRYFDQEMPPVRTHVRRWRRKLEVESAKAIENRYAELVAELGPLRATFESALPVSETAGDQAR